ncbi:carbohydrate kinase [Candidatus Bathyarchaeota archaeon]|nr:carbohydrate kinase [Candidatus Bathyarchaeota archaeon]
MTRTLIVAHDIGTSGTKSALVEIDDSVRIIRSYISSHKLIHDPKVPHSAEQDVESWWNATCKGTRKVVHGESIDALVFCVQANGAVFVDGEGKALANAFTWLDGRAVDQINRHFKSGLFTYGGYNLFKAIRFLRITGAGPGSPKDPLWKYIWFKEREPEKFSRVHKFLDARDYMLYRTTGNYCTAPDSANLTWLFDTRPGKFKWSKPLCKMCGVDMSHLPEIRDSTDKAGILLSRPAKELGLDASIPVIMGGNDSSCIAVGSGATSPGDVHVYNGTSGWTMAFLEKRKINLKYFEASICGAIPGMYQFIGELETAGASLAWARDHLATLEVARARKQGCSEYEFLDDIISRTGVKENGVLFMPWLLGNRSPREDQHVRGAFFNLNLQTRRQDMFRAILEGVSLHQRWILEGFTHVMEVPPILRYIGGGAKSRIWARIHADVLGKEIVPVANPQDGGTIGAAMIAGVALGIAEFSDANHLIKTGPPLQPRKAMHELYTKKFEAMKQFHDNNRDTFRILNP